MIASIGFFVIAGFAVTWLSLEGLRGLLNDIVERLDQDARWHAEALKVLLERLDRIEKKGEK